jgi:hypothetical protein
MKIAMRFGLALILLGMNFCSSDYNNSHRAINEDEDNEVFESRNKNKIKPLINPFADNGSFQVTAGMGLTESALKTAFTGQDFIMSCQSSASKNLSEIWSQNYLLSLFEGGNNYFDQFIDSLQSAGDGISSPDSAVIPMLKAKLGLAAKNNEHWVLNLVSIRPDHLKFSYELNRRTAGQAIDIRYASLIHAIAINPYNSAGGMGEFYRDIREVSAGSQAGLGCRLSEFLKKWTISNQGSLIFSHIAVHDTEPSVGEWRYAEGRVVKRSSPGEMVITETFDNPACPNRSCGEMAGRSLSVVPLNFNYYKYENKKLVPSGSKVTLWHSSESNNQDLILPINGINLPQNHPIRDFGGSRMCIDCHNRKFGVLQSDDAQQLPQVRQNKFRMAGFGLEEPLGYPRPNNHAIFSEVFQQMHQRRSSSIRKFLDDESQCLGTEGFAEVQPYIGLCTDCHHKDNKDGQISLVTKSDWINVIDAATVFVKMGTMPPGSDSGQNQELARVLSCWSKKIVNFTGCSAQTSFENDIKPFQAECSSCHNGIDPLRARLTKKEDWLTYKNVALQLIEAGTMPPGSASENTSKLKEGLRCLAN